MKQIVKKILQKEINVVEYFWMQRRDENKKVKTLEKHLVHFYWCLSEFFSSFVWIVLNLRCILRCDVYVVRACLCDVCERVDFTRGKMDSKSEDEQINSVYAWHYPHFDLQSNLIVRSSVVRQLLLGQRAWTCFWSV